MCHRFFAYLLDSHPWSAGFEPDYITWFESFHQNNLLRFGVNIRTGKGSIRNGYDVMKNNRKSFNNSDLIRLAVSEKFKDQREPPLRIGDLVRLNSGGPVLLVVDFENDLLVLAYRSEGGQAVETTLPIACVHRVSLI